MNSHPTDYWASIQEIERLERRSFQESCVRICAQILVKRGAGHSLLLEAREIKAESFLGSSSNVNFCFQEARVKQNHVSVSIQIPISVFRKLKTEYWASIQEIEDLKDVR